MKFLPCAFSDFPRPVQTGLPKLSAWVGKAPPQGYPPFLQAFLHPLLGDAGQKLLLFLCVCQAKPQLPVISSPEWKLQNSVAKNSKKKKKKMTLFCSCGVISSKPSQPSSQFHLMFSPASPAYFHHLQSSHLNLSPLSSHLQP